MSAWLRYPDLLLQFSSRAQLHFAVRTDNQLVLPSTSSEPLWRRAGRFISISRRCMCRPRLRTQPLYIDVKRHIESMTRPLAKPDSLHIERKKMSRPYLRRTTHHIEETVPAQRRESGSWMRAGVCSHELHLGTGWGILISSSRVRLIH